ncbi:MAG: hypothetical protein Q8P88_00820 [Candidatus Jorgensenbacteria bacterium]|nr:hypothetical protein [Candidatus Jorgensenbacteria bacterium]
MPYHGAIIEESLENLDVLKDVKVVETKVELVTEAHKTPWLKQWMLHMVEIPDDRAEAVAEKLSHALDRAHGGSWYADFKNDTTHFVIFRDKVFKIDRMKKGEYDAAVEYGASLGIPRHQLDFSGALLPTG